MGVRGTPVLQKQVAPTTNTVTVPATLAGSAVLLAIFQRDGAGNAYTVPAGFDLLARTSCSPADAWPLAVYVGHPAAGTTSFAITGTVAGFGVVAVEVTGETQVDDVITIGPSSAAPTFDDVAVSANVCAVGFASVRHDSDVAFTPVSGWTEHIDDYTDGSGDNGPQVAVGSRDIASAGTYDLGWSAPSDDRGGVLVILETGAPVPDPDDEPPAYEPPPPARALVELYLPEDGAARWGEALWGEALWSSSVWTDITPLCVTADVQWGATQPDRGILAAPEAGKWTITTHDPDRLLDPGNADSPYYPNVRSLTPIRVTTRGYVVRQGHLDFVRYDHGDAHEVASGWARPGMLRATDNIALLAAADVPEDTVLPDTLWARTHAVVAAAGVPVPVAWPRGALLGGDPALAPWEPGRFRAWAIILASAQEVGYVPYLTNVGTLHFRAWDDPMDRDAVIGSPELVSLASETLDDGLVSVVEVEDVTDGPIVRAITPPPRYGRRVHRRTLATIDGEAYADRILRDRWASSLRWRPGAIRPLDAAAVEWYGRREVNELATLLHEDAAPVVEVRTRILGGRFYIRDLGSRPDWRFYFACSTEALQPLVADALPFGTPSNLTLTDDDTGDPLYPDGVSGLTD